MFTRFTGGKEGTLWYYRNLAEVFRQIFPGNLSSELTAAVVEMEALAAPAPSLRPNVRRPVCDPENWLRD
jgi:hypothetical protein